MEASRETTTPRPVCAREALDLLNCAAESPFDRDNCLRLLDALRSCIADKKVKKFALAEQNNADRAATSETKP